MRADAAPDRNRYFSRAAAKALEAIEIMGRHAGPLPLGMLARSLGLVKTSALRILHTLEAMGYAERNAEGSYTLTRERSTGSSQLVSKLLRAAEASMKQLNLQLGETVSLAVLFNNHIEVIAVVESAHQIKMSNTVGRIIPPHASSLGKAITAFQTEAVQGKLLRCYGLSRFTPTTITDELELSKELEATRARRYAIDKEESASGGCCFGAPLFGAGGEAIAAVSVSIPIGRLKNHERAQLVAAVCGTAAQILPRAGKAGVPRRRATKAARR